MRPRTVAVTPARTHMHTRPRESVQHTQANDATKHAQLSRTQRQLETGTVLQMNDVTNRHVSGALGAQTSGAQGLPRQELAASPRKTVRWTHAAFRAPLT